MRAVQVTVEDGPEALNVIELPDPVGELLVRVRAAGVSFPDLLMTRGEYQMRQPLPFTLGFEAAGDVIKAPVGGPFTVGDRVTTMSVGGYAEVVAAIPEMTFALPSGLSYAEGASLPLNYLTALAAVERRGGLEPGETVLVHGAAGGVGTACTQIAKALGGHVIGAVSTEAKAEIARLAGADEVVLGDDFRAQLPGPVNLVIDPVGGQERFTDSLRSLAPEGRVVVVGFAGGEIPTVKVNRLLLGNTDVRGCAFGVLALSPDGLAGAIRRLGELISGGAFRPMIGAEYPLDQIKDALRDLDGRRATGKLVLTLDDPSER